MSSQSEMNAPQYSVVEPAAHTLHNCRSPEEFRPRFEAATQCPVQRVADHVVTATAPKAIFLVGSLPLGMGTSGSDIDLVVLIDDRTALLKGAASIANSDQQLEFSSDHDPLLAGMFVTLENGILVDLQVVITPMIGSVYGRLRRRGPELSEGEIRTLGRLSTGWLLWQSEGYLEQSGVVLKDPALEVYCCTKDFVAALINRRKAVKALDLGDIPLALQLARSSVEWAYLAYFASEGMAYLGSKWLAQIGHAHGAADRVRQYPLLEQGVPLLFPPYEPSPARASGYLQLVSEFLASMRALIEQKVLFRIAFQACPQIGCA